MSLGYALGYLGIVLALLSCIMKSMQPLRTVALAGNVIGMAYGYMEGVWPTFVGNLLLLPINGVRLWEIRKLISDIENATRESSIADVLLPHMQLRRVKAGTTLFHKGDLAHEMLYLQSGRIQLPEINKTLEAGALFGEIGLFARDSKRRQTAVCETDCELYAMTRERVYTLYYQNPKIGFNLMSMIVERLLPENGPTQKSPAA